MDQGSNVFYRERIIDMVSQIGTEQFLEMIYGFVSVCYEQEEEKRGTEERQEGLPLPSGIPGRDSG